MKLLIFAHTPPPHHGQSYMVKLMLEGFGGDIRQRGKTKTSEGKSDIECYHVNCRYSDDLEDIGSVRLEKSWLVLRYCLEAIWCRCRYKVPAFYYVPAPGKRAALYRDWIVMLLCRPFFRQVIHHWHAVGLGDWLEREGSWIERWLTHRLLSRPALGIALAIPSMRDSLWFRSRRVEIVANGIPDPCPDFDSTVLARRLRRVAARRQLIVGHPLPGECARKTSEDTIFHVLYLAHCTREKGLFDTLDGVASANQRLRDGGSPLRCQLTVAGVFPREKDEAEFRERREQPDLTGAVRHVGFVNEAQKEELLRTSDALCFPTYYHAESFGLVVVEAMAAGLVVVTTRWRALPDLLPADYPGFVPPRDPAAVADALLAGLVEDGTALREIFLSRFTEQRHLETLRNALCRL